MIITFKLSESIIPILTAEDIKETLLIIILKSTINILLKSIDKSIICNNGIKGIIVVSYF